MKPTLPANRPKGRMPLSPLLLRKAGGPGTELTKLLSRLGITYTADCKCKSRAAQMDRNGCKWCRENIDTIAGWMNEEAEARKLPFSLFAARQLIKLAIRRAR